jgi:hypothetical protein
MGVASSSFALLVSLSFLKHPVPTTRFIEEVSFVSVEILVAEESPGTRLRTMMVPC